MRRSYFRPPQEGDVHVPVQRSSGFDECVGADVGAGADVGVGVGAADVVSAGVTAYGIVSGGGVDVVATDVVVEPGEVDVHPLTAAVVAAAAEAERNAKASVDERKVSSSARWHEARAPMGL
jgi:hypothetical protein